MSNTDNVLYAPLSEIEQIKLMNQEQFYAWVKTLINSDKLGTYTSQEWDDILDAITARLPILKS
jgi:hypothetical protein